ncbi:hypothetical protein EVAR_49369_1 [Eumeta japonica]|uniref:Uncharacterized protein n=1 Tax=Eumeta variegata TaxID=151549 RepID=A0A4C1XXT2_EUMVA|nr:hypothetical protein EVAR_49369_1 [Eumeta japonica]
MALPSVKYNVFLFVVLFDGEAGDYPWAIEEFKTRQNFTHAAEDGERRPPRAPLNRVNRGERPQICTHTGSALTGGKTIGGGERRRGRGPPAPNASSWQSNFDSGLTLAAVGAAREGAPQWAYLKIWSFD